MASPNTPSNEPLNDWEIIEFDGPGDNTVRPARPELRALLEKEREKIHRLLEERAKKKAQASEPDNGSK